MRQTTIVLGGKEQAVNELPSRKNRAWRERLKETLAPVYEILQDPAQIVALNITADNAGETLPSLIETLRPLAATILDSPELVSDLLVAYDGSIEQRLDEAYDSELFDALVKVLELAFPFGSLLELVKRASTASTTSMSGGVNGQTPQATATS